MSGRAPAFITLRNQAGNPWVTVPIIRAEAGLAITPCVDHTAGREPPRNRYLVTHLKSGKKIAGGDRGISRRRAVAAMAKFLALPINWTQAAGPVLRESKRHMEAIRAIREEVRS